MAQKEECVNFYSDTHDNVQKGVMNIIEQSYQKKPSIIKQFLNVIFLIKNYKQIIQWFLTRFLVRYILIVPKQLLRRVATIQDLMQGWKQEIFF